MSGFGRHGGHRGGGCNGCGGGCGGGCGCPKPCCINTCYDAGGDCNQQSGQAIDANCCYTFTKLQFGPVKVDCVTITGDGTCNQPLGAIGLRSQLVNPMTSLALVGTGNNINIQMLGGQANYTSPFDYTKGGLMKLVTTTGYGATASAEVVIGAGVANPSIIGDFVDLIVNPSMITIQGLVQLRTIVNQVNSANLFVTASQDATSTPNARIVNSTTFVIANEAPTITFAWVLVTGAGAGLTKLRLQINNPGLMQCKVSCYFTMTYSQL